MIKVWTGLPGHGKTTALATVALKLLKRNETMFKKHGFSRLLYTNIRFSSDIEKRYSQFIVYFSDIYEMPNWKECDILIDELATYFDAHDWERLPAKIKRYLRLHRHYNVNIYAIAQDFLTIDKSFRRLTSDLIHVSKIIKTREPSKLTPPIKHPFLIGVERFVDKSYWELEKEHYQYLDDGFLGFIASIVWYSKDHFSIFDTSQDIPEQPLPPLVKQVRICPEDGYKKTRYI